MNNFALPFSFTLPTKIVYGPKCIASLIDELKLNDGERPIIITDKGVSNAGILDKITALLKQNNINYIVYDGVEPNPKDVNVEDGAKAAREFGADSIIAIGGGSPIDCAKSVGVLIAHNGDKIKEYEGKTAATKPLPLLITIPTTSGTGSELTFSSVITDTENNYKMTVKSQYTAAKVAICDPELTLSLPAHITASTGMDALTHAIEAYTATCAEPISDALALYATELIYNSLVTAVNDGSNLEARSAMLLGSMLAGIAFSHSDVASVHCIAESLGGVYDLPHGVCNAIFLPHVMEYNMEYSVERYARLAKAMGLNFNSESEGAKKAVEAVKKLTVDVNLPLFSSLNVNTDDFEKIAEMSVKNISTESNPRPMTKKDYLIVIKNAYGHK
ncbi:iron-containing alcohol dehydrogenase [Sedimentibacter hydroxybenzoicus DSM 7310]|uniref:Iron-containing alcohol dehydrogenase n=1 Tax=Sedimentibacter hydroxybenzoicus DSM 7310 TaxID=1123245 RepID=A0A974BJM6_SEDHY|nr:iron-containing alcohol dehydrogenase [Sedimentibacter hydroxybenzoicus]NYB74101.1 iron-containing alcohol dehydrogenase [Sedimentibacter hydroxybenzoicus DSM 7310]